MKNTQEFLEMLNSVKSDKSVEELVNFFYDNYANVDTELSDNELAGELLYELEETEETDNLTEALESIYFSNIIRVL